jgi:hypothetical protein
LKQYDATLVFITASSIMKSQLLAIVKKTDVTLSKRKIDSEILWRLEPLSGESSSVSEQIKSITSVISKKSLQEQRGLFKEVYFDVVIYYDSYTCSLKLPNECLQNMTKLCQDISVEITCYPTKFTEF